MRFHRGQRSWAGGASQSATSDITPRERMPGLCLTPQSRPPPTRMLTIPEGNSPNAQVFGPISAGLVLPPLTVGFQGEARLA